MHKIIFSFAVVWLSVMGNTLLAGDFTWENIGPASLGYQVLLVNAHNNKIIFAAGSGNIFKTDDGGKNWRRILTIRSQLRNINALVTGQNNANLVYAATDNGLYRSNNLGERWQRIFRGKNNQENQCTSVGIDGQTILVGTKTGVFISRDNGRSWRKQVAELDNRGILNIDLGPGQNSIIYLAAEDGIFKSLDSGQSWERIFVGYAGEKIEEESISLDEDVSERKANVYFVKADKNNTNLLYFSSARGVYRSLNQGKSWEKLTEYGLLNRDVKMICLSDSSQILALTSSGVFLYKNERWLEVSFGLSPDKLSYFTLDNLNNIYIAGGKGVYKSSQNNVFNSKHGYLLEEYLKYEPSIRDVQEAAIKFAEVSPEKISQWRKDASRKAFLPQINVGLERNSTDLWHWEGGSTTKSDDDVLHRGKDNVDWDVSLTWDLSDLIFNDAQTSIDVRSKLMVELREDILDQVNKLYFERLRVKGELDNLALEDRRKRFQNELKLEELTASLDALTCGYYSNQLRILASKQQG
ncbi:MAG: hypothetical protein V1830_05920 [Candidatus Omnitrophota bacterium]